jgi:hypothetical protein
MTTSDGIIEMTNFEPDTTPTVCPTEVVKNLNNKDFINVYCVWNNCEKIYTLAKVEIFLLITYLLHDLMNNNIYFLIYTVSLIFPFIGMVGINEFYWLGIKIYYIYKAFSILIWLLILITYFMRISVYGILWYMSIIIYETWFLKQIYYFYMDILLLPDNIVKRLRSARLNDIIIPY